MILHTLYRLFDQDLESENKDQKRYTPADIERVVCTPGSGVEPNIIRVGLYLAEEFGVFSSVQKDTQQVFITSFQPSERIYEVMSSESPWEERIRQGSTSIERKQNESSQGILSSWVVPVESEEFTPVDRTDDRKYAQLAVEEARKSVPEDERVHPKVGVVVVKDKRILASAHRGEIPQCHAEFIALEEKLADVPLSGATVYTTLEPCTARTHPKVPCATRLAERKVARVVIGMLDPDNRISGRGLRALRKAGITTDLFPHDLMAEVEELNREFMRERESHEPTLKAPLYTDDDERKKMIDSVVLTIRTDNGHQRNYTILVDNHSQFDVEIKRICLWSKDQTARSGNDQRVSKPAFRPDNANWSVPARRSISIQFDAQEDVAQRLWQLAGYPEDVDRWTAKKLGSARQFQIEVRVVLRCKISGLERDFEDTRTVQVDFINRHITGV